MQAYVTSVEKGAQTLSTRVIAVEWVTVEPKKKALKKQIEETAIQALREKMEEYKYNGV